MRNRGKTTLLSGAAFIALSLTASRAASQNIQLAEASAPVIGEVVVTAERTASKLQDTPLAIATVSADEAREHGIQNLNDLSGRVAGFYSPGLTPTHNSGAFYIRGIGETSSLNAQAVSVYLDDVYLPRPQGSGLDLLDVEQVQVLRGPQGTLYGRNSSAGSVVVTTRKPGNDFHVAAQAEAGNYGQAILRGVVSGPIVEDKLAGSISFVHNRRDGIYHNAYLGDDNMKIKDDFVMAKLKYTPTNNLEFLLSADYDWDYSDPLAQQVRPGPSSAFFTIPGGYKPYVIYNGYETYNRYKGGGVSLVSTWSPNETDTVKSISSIRVLRQLGLYDPDGTPQDRVRIFSDFEDASYAEELQWLHKAGRLQTVAGAFLFRERFGSTRVTTAGGQLGLPPTTAASVEHINSIAVYAQAAYDLTDAARLTVGGRLTRDAHDFVDTIWIAAAQKYHVEPATTTDTKFTPKVVLDYRWSPNLFTYASVSEGMRSGGYDNNATTIQGATTVIKPETVRAYELGVKSDLFAQRLRNNLAIYYNDYTDLQSSLLDRTTAVTIRTNVGSAYSKGVELESTAILFPGLEWANTVSYTRTRILKYRDDPTKIGNKLPNAPEWFASSWLTYTTQLPNAGELRFGVGYQYRSDSFSDVSNTATGLIPPSYNWDGNITYTAPNRRLSLALVVNNIANRANITSANFVAAPIGYSTYTLANPRLWLVRLRYDY